MYTYNADQWVKLKAWYWSNIYSVNIATYHLRGINLTLECVKDHILPELHYNDWRSTHLASGSTQTAIHFTRQHEDEEMLGNLTLESAGARKQFSIIPQSTDSIQGGDDVKYFIVTRPFPWRKICGRIIEDPTNYDL